MGETLYLSLNPTNKMRIFTLPHKEHPKKFQQIMSEVGNFANESKKLA